DRNVTGVQTCALPIYAVESLDISILQNEILSPILGIKNTKTDKRIQFIGGIRGLSELERLVDAQGGSSFALYPTSMEELFRAARSEERRVGTECDSAM